MNHKAYETKIKDLSEKQRSHLAWRLDHKTICGYVTAIHIARGNGTYADQTLYEIFTSMECSPRSAKIHSKKVVDFN
jgi:hypothetical protein